jgi:rubrerythrin
MDEAKRQRMLAALKDGIMTEIKGQQLYSHAATQTEDPSAKSMFETLAKEEEIHVQILQGQFESLSQEGRLDLSKVHPAEIDHGSGTVIDDAFRKSIKRGKFEMAVIGIGCDLENKAIAYYKEQAEKAEDPELRKLFEWMHDWEVGHLEYLSELERMMQDQYWAERDFSPM